MLKIVYCRSYFKSPELRIALNEIMNDITQKPDTRTMDKGLYNKFQHLETVFMVDLWNKIFLDIIGLGSSCSGGSSGTLAGLEIS